jgi:hypothetical protein
MAKARFLLSTRSNLVYVETPWARQPVGKDRIVSWNAEVR